jgi:hypothetical protein
MDPAEPERDPLLLRWIDATGEKLYNEKEEGPGLKEFWLGSFGGLVSFAMGEWMERTSNLKRLPSVSGGERLGDEKSSFPMAAI